MTDRETGYNFFKSRAKKDGCMSDNYPVALGAIKGFLALEEEGLITEKEANERIYGVFDAIPYFI